MGAAGPSWCPTPEALITPRAASAMPAPTSSGFLKPSPSFLRTFFNVPQNLAVSTPLWAFLVSQTSVLDSEQLDGKHRGVSSQTSDSVLVYPVWWPLSLNQTE